jgi:sorting and assembly machinery component 37
MAFGYLALMLYPSVPQAWLKEALETRFPRLGQYVQRMRKQLIAGEDIKPADIWALSSSNYDDTEIHGKLRQLGLHLPWRPRPSGGFYAKLGKATYELSRKFPLFSAVLQHRAIIQDDSPKTPTKISSSLPSALTVNTLVAFSATVTAAIAALAIQHRRSPRAGPLIFWALRPQMGGLAGLGEAGDFLSVFANNLNI